VATRPPTKRPVGHAGGVEHRGEAARGGLHLLGREPPDETARYLLGGVPVSLGRR
jgi:hypothetical protein